MYCAVSVSNMGEKDFNLFTYPASDYDGNLLEDKWDNGLRNVITAKSIEICVKHSGASEYKQETFVSDIDVNFYVTDSRVALQCRKYDKGGGWTGGVGAIVANAGSKILAASRSKGKVLLGHIRYEWIFLVSYRRKTGWLSTDTIEVYYRDDEKNDWLVGLTFSKGTDVAFIANDIVSRACKYRLEMTNEKTESDIEFFNKYANGAKIPPNSNEKKLTECLFPCMILAPKGENYRPER